MTRLLVYTDLHLTAKRPIHRIDDFEHTMIDKLKEVYQIAADKQVDAVLFLGDFFNNHRIFSYDLINAAMDAVCGATVDTLAIVGQHDLVGRNQDSYASSTLCFMERHCPRFKTMHAPTDLGDAIVYPCHCWDDFPATVKAPASKKKKSILAAHHLITMEKKIFDTYTVDSFLPCNYSAVIFGDYHAGSDGPYRDGSTLVWSPGAMARLAINDAHRMVRIGIMTATPGMPIDVEEIPLQTAKPGSEVLGKTFLEGVREHADIDATSFINKIMSLEADSSDIFDLVKKAALQEGTKQEIVDYIMSKRT